jgi:hypothetical protein
MASKNTGGTEVGQTGDDVLIGASLDDLLIGRSGNKRPLKRGRRPRPDQGRAEATT